MNKQTIGNVGESLACEFLVKKGFVVIERNYRKRWGELDIIAQKDDVLHFVEVKTVSKFSDDSFGHRPEENVHAQKQKRMGRAIQTYLSERNKEDQDFQIDVLAITLDPKTQHANIRFIEKVLITQ